MRLVFEIFPSFCYRRTRNEILQLLLRGNYVVAILPTGFGKYRSFAKQN
jgi:superfamily II DNA helicase RecQ